MRQLRVGNEAGEQRADLGHAGLVVRREERGAVGADDVLTHKLGEVGDLVRRGLDRLAVNDAGHERAALVAHHVRAHAGSGGVRRGVDVGAEQQRRALLGAGRGGQGARDVGVLVHGDVHAADLAELVAQVARHLVLARRGRSDVHVVRVGLGINLHIAHEALKNVGHGASFDGFLA